MERNNFCSVFFLSLTSLQCHDMTCMYVLCRHCNWFIIFFQSLFIITSCLSVFVKKDISYDTSIRTYDNQFFHTNSHSISCKEALQSSKLLPCPNSYMSEMCKHAWGMQFRFGTKAVFCLHTWPFLYRGNNEEFQKWDETNTKFGTMTHQSLFPYQKTYHNNNPTSKKHQLKLAYWFDIKYFTKNIIFLD